MGTRLRPLAAVLASLAFGLVAHERGAAASAPTRPDLAKAYLALPLAFERNDGQAPPEVAYLARGIGHALALTRDAAVLSLERPAPAPWAALRLEFVCAAPDPTIRGLDELPGRSHYLRGPDRAAWRTGVPSFARVAYRDLYPGVDLVFHGSGQRLEYDFVVAPGAAPGVIRLRVGGVDALALDAAGDLHLRTGSRELVQRAPRTHQEADGRRVEIASRFVLRSDREIGFEVASYDHGRPLVIDPVLVYASHLGGSGEDGAATSSLGEHLGIAVDASGSAVIVGATQSTDFPIANATQPDPGGGMDVFVAKLASNGRSLVYSTYLGGSDDDGARAVAIDPGGNAVVVGATRSSDFPTLAAGQSALGGRSDAFVAKLSPLGTLLFSTFLGGSGDDAAAAVAIDAQRNLHVAGVTGSNDFPVRAALQSSAGGGRDAFVARLAPDGAMASVSYLGGSGEDAASAIAVNAVGVYVAGETSSSDFPTHAPLQASPSGGLDAFVARLTPDETSLAYASYFGGSGADAAHGVVVLPSGVAVVIGGTTSTDLPTAGPLQAASGGAADAFIAGFRADDSGLVFATYLGGSGDDDGVGLVIAQGALFATGVTDSADFPTVAPMQAAIAGERDAWLARLSAGGAALAFSTYLGGEGTDSAFGLAATPEGRLFVGGYTESRLFPTVAALKQDLGVGTDAFVSAIDAATTSFVYSTYLGGSSEELPSVLGQRIAVDGAGHAYLTGPTLSPDLATGGVLQPAPGGGSDALVAKVDVDGSSLVYATYLGGAGDDAGLGIAVDAAGSAYVTGRTDSADFPTASAVQPTKAAGFDAFVAKLAPEGDALVYSTFLGGGGSDFARGIAIDPAGGAVIAGVTSSSDFPVHRALQPLSGGGLDAFLAKLTPAGDVLDWATYLGGSGDENPSNTTWGLALDRAGNVVAAGTTESDDFPLVAPVQAVHGASRDAYVAKIAADGSRLLFSTYLGGSSGDTARDVATDAFGRIYVVGATRSSNFPVVNAIQPLHNDPLWYDAFLARIGPGPNGPALDFSTFLGGRLLDGALGVAVDVAGNVYVAGQTDSPDFPIVGGDAPPQGGDDAFLIVLPAAGDRIAYSTRIGGASGDVALGVAVDGAGSAYLAGITESGDFPSVAPLQPEPGVSPDAFVAKIALAPGAVGCEVATDRPSYALGEVVGVSRLHIANAGGLPLRARLRIELDAPGIGPFELFRGLLELPAALDADLAPFPLFTVGTGEPRGGWTLACTLEDPVTGAPNSSQVAGFSIP